MTIQTYWELTEAERAKLTVEEVDAFAAVELMTKGVIDPGELKLEEEVDFKPRVRPWYLVGDIAFGTAGDASAFLSLMPMKVTSDWAVGYDVSFVQPLPGEMVVKELPDRAEVLERGRAHYTKRKAIREENAKRKDEHEKLSKAKREALADMWNDWTACGSRLTCAERTRDTFRKYVKLTNGDEGMAAKFLYEALGPGSIREAQTMMGETFGCNEDGVPSGYDAAAPHEHAATTLAKDEEAADGPAF